MGTPHLSLPHYSDAYPLVSGVLGTSGIGSAHIKLLIVKCFLILILYLEQAMVLTSLSILLFSSLLFFIIKFVNLGGAFIYVYLLSHTQRYNYLNMFLETPSLFVLPVHPLFVFSSFTLKKLSNVLGVVF